VRLLCTSLLSSDSLQSWTTSAVRVRMNAGTDALDPGLAAFRTREVTAARGQAAAHASGLSASERGGTTYSVITVAAKVRTNVA
jgi:hypothetical protein